MTDIPFEDWADKYYPSYQANFDNCMQALVIYKMYLHDLRYFYSHMIQLEPLNSHPEIDGYFE